MRTTCLCGCGGELPRRAGKGRGRFKLSLPGHRTLSIRQLRSGEPIPAWVARRYKTGSGYIRLRWRMPGGEYVEAYEHRIIAGVVVGEVHHRNGNKTDNTPENLEVLSRSEHARLHGLEHEKFSISDAADLYRNGFGLRRIAAKFGVHPVTVMRRLKQFGVQMRPKQRNDLIRPVSV